MPDPRSDLRDADVMADWWQSIAPTTFHGRVGPVGAQTLYTVTRSGDDIAEMWVTPPNGVPFHVALRPEAEYVAGLGVTA